MATPDSRQSRVIAAFPATGKSWLAESDPMRFRDCDSSRFSRDTSGIRHPNWPSNYMAVIRSTLDGGASVLCSTHKEVRTALAAARIPFTLVYPAPFLRDEYRERMVHRGSPSELVRKVIDELWARALLDCRRQAGCFHVELGPGQYLSDVVER